MQHVYIIADTHFGHSKICAFQPEHRPFATVEEHDRELIARWNAVVKPKDTVWHLGDVYFGKKGAAALPYLNGNKKLVMGNHDGQTSEIDAHFTRTFGAVVYKNAILTHIPIHSSEVGRFGLNVHGHLHSLRVLRMDGSIDPRYRCVSAEHTNLAPVRIDDVLSDRWDYFT
jgi:calcineurin-like phosphoesterase family protein